MKTSQKIGFQLVFEDFGDNNDKYVSPIPDSQLFFRHRLISMNRAYWLFGLFLLLSIANQLENLL